MIVNNNHHSSSSSNNRGNVVGGGGGGVPIKQISSPPLYSMLSSNNNISGVGVGGGGVNRHQFSVNKPDSLFNQQQQQHNNYKPLNQYNEPNNNNINNNNNNNVHSNHNGHMSSTGDYNNRPSSMSSYMSRQNPIQQQQQQHQQQQQQHQQKDWRYLLNGHDIVQLIKDNEAKTLLTLAESASQLLNIDLDSKLRGRLDSDTVKLLRLFQFTSTYLMSLSDRDVRPAEAYSHTFLSNLQHLKQRNLKMAQDIDDVMSALPTPQDQHTFDPWKSFEARYRRKMEEMEEAHIDNSKWMNDQMKSLIRGKKQAGIDQSHTPANVPPPSSVSGYGNSLHHLHNIHQSGNHNMDDDIRVRNNNSQYDINNNNASMMKQHLTQQQQPSLSSTKLRELIKDELYPYVDPISSSITSVQQDINFVRDEVLKIVQAGKNAEKEKKKTVQLHKKIESLKERFDKLESILLNLPNLTEEEVISDSRPNERITTPPSRSPQYLSLINRPYKLLCYFKHSNEKIEKEREAIASQLNDMLNQKGVVQTGLTKAELADLMSELEMERQTDNNYDEQAEMRAHLESVIDDVIAQQLYTTFVDPTQSEPPTNQLHHSTPLIKQQSSDMLSGSSHLLMGYNNSSSLTRMPKSNNSTPNIAMGRQSPPPQQRGSPDNLDLSSEDSDKRHISYIHSRGGGGDGGVDMGRRGSTNSNSNINNNILNDLVMEDQIIQKYLENVKQENNQQDASSIGEDNSEVESNSSGNDTHSKSKSHHRHDIAKSSDDDNDDEEEEEDDDDVVLR
ncbi:hypothetical protein SAMD00019534_095780 [Acytostelium subglobosum LB1]|uniref:hypothetical protein n=1 Tax=Acytostelium subglobosum LB1 TaxID=1410327 RepID=UPI000644AB4A|nr:hypothetical protein SAMD00019534_095780 [Acytostelium subglobosum LB1]GAM26403.1 hypothetical protein SAMD00019534_095780 [Acytostelium subglobosum LB1]|eukprot:XP_012750499.1 hypothetical protein SAMD00019534_095780 [Acytostelium subglobosum LB1]